MKKSSRALFLAVIGLALVAVVLVVTRLPMPLDTLPLTQVFDDSPQGFTIRYPADWDYTIPIHGLILFGPNATLFQAKPGPTFTIQRLGPLAAFGALEEALDLYLRRGPLREDRLWEQQGQITTTTLRNRPALRVEITGREFQDSPESRVNILATLAQNTFVYVIAMTAPLENWPAVERTLQAMLDSLEILE
jgi:hypothetical protein